MLASIDYDLKADREAEEAAIACCVRSSENARKFLSLVKRDDLLLPESQTAYERMAELVDAGEEVNIWTLAHKGVSSTWLHDLLRGNVTTGSVTLEFWAEFIQRQGRARYVAKKAIAALEAVMNGRHPDDVAYDLGQAMRLSISQKARTRSLGEVISEDGYPELLEWMRDPRKLAGPSTGLDRLDLFLGGLGAGRLIALGADTGIGKSAFVQHLARECSRNGAATHVVSTEMSDLEVNFRLAFMEAGWDKLKVAKRGQTYDYERDAMLDGLDRLANLPMYLTELRGMNVDALEAEARRVKEQFGTEVLILDLLNGLPVVGDNRAQGIAVNTSRLKQMAESLRVCVLMTAHVNRESAKGISELGLHSFKDSGAIEADADQALILIPTDDKGGRMPREEVARIVNNGNPVDVAIRIVKNRHGAEGQVSARLHWGHGGRFYPVSA